MWGGDRTSAIHLEQTAATPEYRSDERRSHTLRRAHVVEVSVSHLPVAHFGMITNRLIKLQVRNLEKVGLTRQQSERLTEHLTEVLCTHKEKLAQDFVSKALLEKVKAYCSSVARYQ